MLISNKVKVLWTHLHKYFYDCNKYFRSSSLFQFSSVTQSCPTLCVPMDCSTQASLSITNSQSLLKLMSIKSVMPSNHLILCHPLFRLSSVFSTIRVFSNESALHIRWPSIGASASASVLPVNIQDWFPLGWTGWSCSPRDGLSGVFSNTTVEKYQFFSTQLSWQSNSHIHTWPLENP